MKNREEKRRALTLPELLLVIVVTGVLATLAVPNFGGGRRRPAYRSCYANMKNIAGALEMYNLDHDAEATLESPNHPLNSPGNKADRIISYASLVKNGYLQSIPRHPYTTETAEKIYCIDENGWVYCKSKITDFENDIHGYIQNPKPAEN